MIQPQLVPGLWSLPLSGIPCIAGSQPDDIALGDDLSRFLTGLPAAKNPPGLGHPEPMLGHEVGHVQDLIFVLEE